jgi:hypothetical protein
MVSLPKIQYDPAHREIACTLRILNRSAAPIAPPITVALGTGSAAVRLIEADGYTCAEFDPGAPYVVVAADSALAPGAMVERALRFQNLRQQTMRLVGRVFSGRPPR